MTDVTTTKVCTHGAWESHCGRCTVDGVHCIDLPSDKRVVSHTHNFNGVDRGETIDGKYCLVIGILDRVVSSSGNMKSAKKGEYVDGKNVVVLPPGWEVVCAPKFEEYTGGYVDDKNVILKDFHKPIKVVWDNDKAKVDKEAPDVLFQVTLKNSTKEPAELSQDINKTVTETHSFSSTGSRTLSIGLSGELSKGVEAGGGNAPKVSTGGKAGLQLGYTQSWSETVTRGNSSSKSVTATVKVPNVPPGQTRKITFLGEKAKFSVPGKFVIGNGEYEYKFFYQGAECYNFKAEVVDPDTHQPVPSQTVMNAK